VNVDISICKDMINILLNNQKIEKKMIFLYFFCVKGAFYVV